MRELLRVLAVYSFLFSIFIVEGLGLPNGRQYARMIIGVFPLLLFFTDFIQKKEIRIPFHIATLFVLFSITTAISTITAVNIQTAFENQLMYAGVFLIFIYAFNHQELKKYLPHFIFFLTMLLIIYSVFINYFLPIHLSWLIPQSGFQFPYIHNNTNSHFSFGAFVLIPLVFFLKYFLHKPTWIKGISLSVLVILLLISFLRSAYVAFISVAAVSFFYSSNLKEKKRALILCVIIGIMSLSAFFLITNFKNEAISNLPLKKIIVEHFELLSFKTVLNSRDQFISQSFEAINTKPFTGFGSFNYYYASLLFARNVSYASGTSHNMFLDIFVENGIFGGAIYILLILYLIKKMWPFMKENTIIDTSIFFVALSLLLLFQLSHYHKFYFLYIFVFFLIALVYKEKNVIKDAFLMTIQIAGLLFLMSCIIIVSLHLSRNGMHEKAIKLYPISVSAHQSHILSLKEKNDLQELNRYLDQLSNLYPREPNIQDFIANIYTLNSDHQNALDHYLTALKASPSEPAYLTFIYEELKALKGEEAAKEFVSSYIQENIGYFEVYSFEQHWFYEWCVERKIYIYNWMLLTE